MNQIEYSIMKKALKKMIMENEDFLFTKRYLISHFRKNTMAGYSEDKLDREIRRMVSEFIKEDHVPILGLSGKGYIYTRDVKKIKEFQQREVIPRLVAAKETSDAIDIILTELPNSPHYQPQDGLPGF